MSDPFLCQACRAEVGELTPADMHRMVQEGRFACPHCGEAKGFTRRSVFAKPVVCRVAGVVLRDGEGRKILAVCTACGNHYSEESITFDPHNDVRQ